VEQNLLFKEENLPFLYKKGEVGLNRKFYLKHELERLKDEQLPD